MATDVDELELLLISMKICLTKLVNTPTLRSHIQLHWANEVVLAKIPPIPPPTHTHTHTHTE